MTAIRLRAERRTGELLVEMEKHHGGNPNLSPRSDRLAARLRDLDITKDESSLWQRLAKIRYSGYPD